MEDNVKKITPGESDYASRIQFEFDGYRILLNEMMRENIKFKFDKEAYDYFMKNYQETLVTREIFLQEMKEIYFPGREGTVNVDFNINEIILSEGETDCSCGSCGVK